MNIHKQSFDADSSKHAPQAASNEMHHAIVKTGRINILVLNKANSFQLKHYGVQPICIEENKGSSHLND